MTKKAKALAKVENNVFQAKPITGKRLGHGVTDDGLTAKQERFAVMVAMGMRYAEAYREAYDAEDMSQASIWNSANALMNNRLVADRVKALIDERKSQSLLADAAFVRQYVFDKLMEESSKAGNSANARIKALELLGKVDVVGMFKERAEVESKRSRTPEEVEAELGEKLSKLMGKVANS